MKKFRKIPGLILTTFLILNTNSCSLLDYKLSEAFYRLMKVEERATNLAVLNNESDIKNIQADEEYDVLIITDVHVGNENKGKNGPRREDAWFSQLQKIDPVTGKAIIDNVKFAICLGDVAEHGFPAEFDRFNSIVTDRLKELKTPKAPDGIKLYSIVGNHDLYNSGWANWSKTQYPGTSFYKFETPSFSWYFLDSASGTIGGEQYDSLKYDMSKDSKLKLIFSHIPIYADNFFYFTMQNTEERNKLINTVSKNNSEFFIDGHTHEERYTDFGTFKEINLPGFLEKYGYGLLHVNENNKTVILETNYF